MLAEKSKQQEELLAEYEEQLTQSKETESEINLLNTQVYSIKEELKVWYDQWQLFLPEFNITWNYIDVLYLIPDS